MNYFDLFGLEEQFDIDISKLTKKYYALSRTEHPDLLSAASGDQVDDAIEKTETLNIAYEVLKDKKKRIEYILSTHGLMQGDQSIDPEFLMEMMEINEQLMELELEPDENNLKTIWAAWEDKTSEIELDGLTWIRRYDNGEKIEEVLLQVKEYFLKSKYLLRIKEKLSTFASA